MSTTTTTVDPADLAAIRRIDVEAIRAAIPAIHRLADADYAGAGTVRDDIDGAAGGTLEQWLADIEQLVACDGDQAKYDYLEFVVNDHLSLAKACSELLDDNEENFPRVDALRRYAAMVTR